MPDPPGLEVLQFLKWETKQRAPWAGLELTALRLPDGTHIHQHNRTICTSDKGGNLRRYRGPAGTGKTDNKLETANVAGTAF